MDKFGVLRHIKETELELILSWRNEESVRSNMYNSKIIKLEDHLAWWDKMKSSDVNHYFMFEDFGCPQGVVAITNISYSNKNASWAFYASPKSQQGAGSKMEFLALDYSFNKLGLHKLWCEVLEFNQPVIKMHKKFGFNEEGVFREQHYTDSGFVDVYRLGILSSEWSEMREKMESKLIRLNRSGG